MHDAVRQDPNAWSACAFIEAVAGLGAIPSDMKFDQASGGDIDRLLIEGHVRNGGDQPSARRSYPGQLQPRGQ